MSISDALLYLWRDKYGFGKDCKLLDDEERQRAIAEEIVKASDSKLENSPLTCEQAKGLLIVYKKVGGERHIRKPAK